MITGVANARFKLNNGQKKNILEQSLDVLWGGKPQSLTSLHQCLYNSSPVSYYYVNYPLCTTVAVKFAVRCWSDSFRDSAAAPAGR